MAAVERDEYLDTLGREWDFEQPIIGHELHISPRLRGCCRVTFGWSTGTYATCPTLWMFIQEARAHWPRGTDAALVESYHALGDRAAVDRALACFVRGATEEEMPPEARAGCSGRAATAALARRGSLLTPAIRERRLRLEASCAVLCAGASLLWWPPCRRRSHRPPQAMVAAAAALSALLLACCSAPSTGRDIGALFDPRRRVAVQAAP